MVVGNLVEVQKYVYDGHNPLIFIGVVVYFILAIIFAAAASSLVVNTEAFTVVVVNPRIKNFFSH